MGSILRLARLIHTIIEIEGTVEGKNNGVDKDWCVKQTYIRCRNYEKVKRLTEAGELLQTCVWTDNQRRKSLKPTIIWFCLNCYTPFILGFVLLPTLITYIFYLGSYNWQ